MLTKQQKEILERADEILKDIENTGRYESTCIKAGICPKCGAGIEKEKDYVERSMKIGMFTKYKCTSVLCNNSNGFEIGGWYFKV